MLNLVSAPRYRSVFRASLVLVVFFKCRSQFGIECPAALFLTMLVGFHKVTYKPGVSHRRFSNLSMSWRLSMGPPYCSMRMAASCICVRVNSFGKLRMKRLYQFMASPAPRPRPRARNARRCRGTGRGSVVLFRRSRSRHFSTCTCPRAPLTPAWPAWASACRETLVS